METALVLLVVQGVLGAFDTVYFHEYKLRLPQVRTARREVHGIHGHGQLQQFLGRISLPALDADGRRTVFTAVIDCVGVPSLREKNRDYGVDIIGIRGRMFLQRALLRIDGLTGRIELQIDG